MVNEPKRSFGIRGRVLVVDDEPQVLELIKRQLEVHQLDVVTAASSEEALQYAKSQPWSLILLDVAMPVMDGFELLRQLRAAHDTNRIPVIMVSGRGDTDTILRSQELNVQDYLIKPIDPQTLIETVERFLHKSG